MTPTGFLRPPDDVAAGLHISHLRRLEIRVFDRVGNQRPRRAGRQRQLDQFEIPLRPVASHEPDLVRPDGPVDAHDPLVAPLLDVDWRHHRGPLLPDVELGLPDVVLTGHRVRVRTQRRARVGQRVDEVKLLHLALVLTRNHERFRIRGPGDVGAHARVAIRRTAASTAALIVLLRGVLHFSRITEAERTVLLAVGGDFRRVGLALLDQIEIVLARKNKHAAVG